MATDFSNVLKWYKGKNAEKAKEALVMLAKCEDAGCWLPGTRAGVKVPAALWKANVVEKVARANDQWLNRKFGVPMGRNSWEPEFNEIRDIGHILYHTMVFGATCADYEEINWEAAFAVCKNDEQRAVIEMAREFIRDMAPVAALIHRLEVSKPAPVFTAVKASRLVTTTLADMGLLAEGNEKTVRVCPMHFERIEQTNPKTGKVESVPVAILDWPAGTRHGTSRFGADGCHCEACGHAIKNLFNWVPMLVDDSQGTPRSMWVGRDCAETLFGVKMTGDLDILKK